MHGGLFPISCTHLPSYFHSTHCPLANLYSNRSFLLVRFELEWISPVYPPKMKAQYTALIKKCCYFLVYWKEGLNKLYLFLSIHDWALPNTNMLSSWTTAEWWYRGAGGVPVVNALKRNNHYSQLPFYLAPCSQNICGIFQFDKQEMILFSEFRKIFNYLPQDLSLTSNRNKSFSMFLLE